MMIRIATYTEISVKISHIYIISWYDITDISYRGISRQDPEFILEKWYDIRLYLYHIRVWYNIT